MMFESQVPECQRAARTIRALREMELGPIPWAGQGPLNQDLPQSKGAGWVSDGNQAQPRVQVTRLVHG